MIRILQCFVTPTLHIPRKSMKVCYISVLKRNRLLIICVVLSLYIRLVKRVLKCFVAPILPYTAQVDESVLHVSIETKLVIDYVCCTCFVSTSNDSRIFILNA